MTPSTPALPSLDAPTWETLAREVARLSRLASGCDLGADLRWRVRALERAVETRSVDLLPLALGATGRAAPPEVEAWSYDGVTETAEVAAVAVWHLAVAALDVAEGGDASALSAPRAVLDAWSHR